MVRTSEDHNGDGTGVPPFPRACTEFQRSNFALEDGVLRLPHFLQAETELVAIRFEPSDKCRLYATDGDPVGGVWSRMPSSTTTGHSTLAGRTLELKVTNFDPPDTAASLFDIVIWEW